LETISCSRNIKIYERSGADEINLQQALLIAFAQFIKAA
jgi:hypothetical protein